MITQLRIDVIKDADVRDAFQRVKEADDKDELSRGQFIFLEITIPHAVTNYQYPHRLGFQPKDIIQTSLIGAGSLTWNYTLFTSTFLDITTTGACTVRLFAGAYL